MEDTLVTYNLVIALVGRLESAFGAVETSLEVKCKLSLSIAWLTTLMASNREGASRHMEIVLRLARVDAFAADALVVVLREVPV
jgi:hypothetical protein